MYLVAHVSSSPWRMVLQFCQANGDLSTSVPTSASAENDTCKQGLYRDNKLDPFFGNAPLHFLPPLGRQARFQTRGVNTDTRQFNKPEINKAGRHCSCL